MPASAQRRACYVPEVAGSGDKGLLRTGELRRNHAAAVMHDTANLCASARTVQITTGVMPVHSSDLWLNAALYLASISASARTVQITTCPPAAFMLVRCQLLDI